MSWSWQEWIAVASYLWSVWLLAGNRALGWWVGLVGTVLYIWIFYVVWLPGEILIQSYFLLTSLWGIWVWLHGGKDHQQKPVARATRKLMIATLVVGLLGWVVAYLAFDSIQGRVPFWDSLTTVVSFIAQFYLVRRFVESWYLWIAVDIIYVPLYASRGLYLTAVLYAIFLLLAYRGLRTFQRELQETAP